MTADQVPIFALAVSLMAVVVALVVNLGYGVYHALRDRRTARERRVYAEMDAARLRKLQRVERDREWVQ